jgi:hypothetical protein
MYSNTLPLISKQNDFATSSAGTPAAASHVTRPAVKAAPAKQTLLQKLFDAWVKPYESMGEITTVM